MILTCYINDLVILDEAKFDAITEEDIVARLSETNLPAEQYEDILSHLRDTFSTHWHVVHIYSFW